MNFEDKANMGGWLMKNWKKLQSLDPIHDSDWELLPTYSKCDYSFIKPLKISWKELGEPEFKLDFKWAYVKAREFEAFIEGML